MDFNPGGFSRGVEQRDRAAVAVPDRRMVVDPGEAQDFGQPRRLLLDEVERERHAPLRPPVAPAVVGEGADPEPAANAPRQAAPVLDRTEPVMEKHQHGLARDGLGAPLAVDVRPVDRDRDRAAAQSPPPSQSSGTS